jgi:hypothetical protein
MFALQGSGLTEITPPGAVASSEPFVWSGAGLATEAIIHDGRMPPWHWPDMNPANQLVPLVNWPAGVTAYTLRSFKQYLIALAVTKDMVFYPTMVKWSHPADPGGVPISWDETDPTKDAGEHVLAETPGQCIDALPMRDTMLIYKQDSVWGMQYIGGVFIFKFYKIFGDWGIPMRNCAVEYISGKHFCFTGSDLYIHDGNSSKSVVNGRLKSILRNITADQLTTCHCAVHAIENEVWFCWRRTMDGYQAADTALVYNYVDDTTALRALPNTRYVAAGLVDPFGTGSEFWATNPFTWATSTTAWSEFASMPSIKRLLGLGEMSILWMDGGTFALNGNFAERQHLGVPIRSGQPPDLSAVKFMSRFWPRLKGPTGAQIEITLGSCDSVAEPTKWKTPIIYTIGVSRKVDCTLTGKLLAVRVRSLNNAPWVYLGMDADLKVAGEM